MAELVAAGARCLGAARPTLPDGIDLVVASPGLRPDPPAAGRRRRAAASPVWGEVELAWRLRGPAPRRGSPLTGTNGKTTTVRMLESILRAAGRRAAGGRQRRRADHRRGAGRPALRRARRRAVELTAALVAPSLPPAAGALLNLAPDHLDWHGSMRGLRRGQDARLARRRRDRQRRRPAGRRLLAGAGARRVGFTLDRAGGRASSASSTARSSTVPSVTTATCARRRRDVRPAGAHNVANALAAAALARAHGVAAAGVGGGPARVRARPAPQPVRRRRARRDWVDDSKATNPHAAAGVAARPTRAWCGSPAASSRARSVDDLVAEHADRLRGAVLLGADRAAGRRRAATTRAGCPRDQVDSTDDGAMTEVVHAAAGLARPGDTVLLAPAAASYDMFTGYGARGDAFAAAVRALGRAERGETRADGAARTTAALRARRAGRRRTRVTGCAGPSASASSTGPTPRCSCCCSPAAGLLGLRHADGGLDDHRRRRTTTAAPARSGRQVVKEIEFIARRRAVFWFAVRMPPRAYRLLAYPIARAGARRAGRGAGARHRRRRQRRAPLDRPRPVAAAAVRVRASSRMLLWGADLLARKQQLGTLRRARHLFVPLLPGFVAASVALVMLEPDLGTTCCFMLILLGLLWMVGMPMRYFVGVVGAGRRRRHRARRRRAVPAAAADHLPAPVQGRARAPASTPSKACTRSPPAACSASVSGRARRSTAGCPTRTPTTSSRSSARSSACIGCLAVLALFGLLAYAGMRIARRSADPFVRLAAGAATSGSCGQALINIGYVTGLLPVTGIPLPFISAGGTSLLAPSSCSACWCPSPGTSRRR